MLFLLFLYYLGANASPSLLPTAPRSPTATLPNNALSNFVICECSYERSIWKIVSGCLLTIFACTWISVHPNLPDPSDTRWKVLLRRSGYMFWTLVTPELVVYWAMRQWVGAKAIETHYQGKYAILPTVSVCKPVNPTRPSRQVDQNSWILPLDGWIHAVRL